MKTRRTLTKGIILLLGISLFFNSLIFAGPNENAGITFDLDATTYGNQNLLKIPEPGAGDYIRLDVYAQDVVNLDTYEFEVVYNPIRLQYITATPTNPITYEQNILTTNGGSAIGWMVDTSTPGVLSIAYTLVGTDTTQAPEGEGLIADIVFQAITTESTHLSFGNVYYHDSYGTMDVITNKGIAFLGGVPPMPPADLIAVSDTVLQNTIRLNWIDPTENADGTPLEDLAGINIYYADETYIASVDPGVENYAVQGLTVGEQYNFYVTAYDDEIPLNESIPSDTTGATMVVAPMSPSDLSLYSDYTTPNSIQLTWTDPIENNDGTPLTDLNSIDVYYADSTFITSVDPGVETYTDDGLTEGQLYSYFLIAVSDNPNSGPYSLFTITLTTSVGGFGWDGSTLDLLVNGDVVLDDITLPYPGPNEKDYTFAVADGDSVFVDYTPGDSYPQRNTYYIYDNIGGLVVSSGVGETILPSDVSFIAALKALSWHAGGSPTPSSPGNLYADAISGGLIQLTWNDPTTQEDGTPLDDLAGINIYADSSFITSVAPGVETYTFTDLIPGQFYYISVTAYDNETPVNESEPNTVEVYNTTILYVQPGSALDSIQVALDYCTIGDTVLVAAGTYYECIIWPRHTHDICLISESGPEVTIIDGIEGGGHFRSVIYLHTGGPGNEDNTPLVEGFTMQNGEGGGYGHFGSLDMAGHGRPTIKGNIISNNLGTGIGYGCTPAIIIDNIITNNGSRGIYMQSSTPDNIITGNIITQNDGPGIRIEWGGTPTIIGNTISENNGHGIDAFEGIPIVTDNVIAGNNGAGIYVRRECGLLTITNCIVTGNLSGGIGGPISKSITNCVVLNNGGTGISGSCWAGIATITNSVISNNDGYGVIHNGRCSIHYCDIYDNTSFGVFNASGQCFPLYTTQSQNNWWGDPDGPFGPNGDGVGCADGQLEDQVYYTPWLTEPSIIKVVSVPDFSCGEPGETISIPVNTTDITGDGVVSAEFTLSYDSTIITEMDIDATGTLLSGTDWTWQSSVVGDTLFVEMSGTDELTGSGTLINLVFVVSPDAQQGQESPLHFVEFIFNEEFPFNPVPVNTEDGVFIAGQMWGVIEGIVAEADKSPIQGAVVTAYARFTYCDTTDANGYYIMPEALNDTYNMIVTASGYNDFDTTGVVLIGGETTQVNFQLTHPEIFVEPTSIDVELPVDITYDTNIMISNPGNGPLDFTISIGEGARFVKSIDISPSLSRGISSIQRDGINHIQRDASPEGMKTGDLFSTFQLAPNAQSGTLEPWQGYPPLSPRFDEEIIHYDGEPYTGIGLTAGGTFEGAIRLTPDELGPYDEWELISALFYHYEEYTHSGNIKIYEQGSSSAPGALITSEPYSVYGPTWLRTDLTTPVTIDATQDLWTSVEITHFAYEYPIGCDAGPAVQGKGGFLSGCCGWSELYLAGFDYNLNIRAIVSQQWLSTTPYSGTVPAGQSLDIIVHFDTRGLTPDSTYTTSILIHNNSAESLVDIPVTMHVTGPGQQLSLGENWNWISFNVHPDDTSIESVFAPLTPDDIHQVMNQTQSATNYGGTWYGTLEEITDGEGYLVNMNNPVNSFIVVGGPIDPATPIALNVPCNWIAYYPQYPILIENAMASIVPNVFQVMNQTQSATYYDPPGEWYGSLEQMAPDIGYKVKMNIADTLIYSGQRASIPDNTIVTRDKTKDPPNWEVIQNTQCHMVLMAEITLEGEEFEGVDDNMAGAFCWIDSLECRGIAIWESGGAGFWYFDIVSNVNIGEEITFKIYDSETDTIYDCNETIIFEDGATVGTPFEPYQLTATLISTDGDYPVFSTKLNSNFPNPFMHSTTISFGLKDKSHVTLSVYNIKGQLVETLIDDEMVPGIYEIPWDVKSGNQKLASGVYFYKLETKNKTFIKKMILMK